jgi:hypothetical protein
LHAFGHSQKPFKTLFLDCAYYPGYRPSPKDPEAEEVVRLKGYYQSFPDHYFFAPGDGSSHVVLASLAAYQQVADAQRPSRSTFQRAIAWITGGIRRYMVLLGASELAEVTLTNARSFSAVIFRSLPSAEADAMTYAEIADKIADEIRSVQSKGFRASWLTSVTSHAEHDSRREMRHFICQAAHRNRLIWEAHLPYLERPFESPPFPVRVLADRQYVLDVGESNGISKGDMFRLLMSKNPRSDIGVPYEVSELFSNSCTLRAYDDAKSPVRHTLPLYAARVGWLTIETEDLAHWFRRRLDDLRDSMASTLAIEWNPSRRQVDVKVTFSNVDGRTMMSICDCRADAKTLPFPYDEIDLAYFAHSVYWYIYCLHESPPGQHLARGVDIELKECVRDDLSLKFVGENLIRNGLINVRHEDEKYYRFSVVNHSDIDLYICVLHFSGDDFSIGTYSDLFQELGVLPSPQHRTSISGGC